MSNEVKKIWDNALLENVQLAFRNFAGKMGKYNAEGDRNFCILLDDETASQMESDGWNIKYLEPRDPEDDRQAYIRVKIKYNFREPNIYMVGSKNKTRLDEATIETLDYMDLRFSDVIIRPYNYEVNGKTGVTAYLETIYANIKEDELYQKYYDVPDSTQHTMLELEGEVILDAEIVEEFEQREIGM